MAERFGYGLDWSGQTAAAEEAEVAEHEQAAQQHRRVKQLGVMALIGSVLALLLIGFLAFKGLQTAGDAIKSNPGITTEP